MNFTSVILNVFDVVVSWLGFGLGLFRTIANILKVSWAQRGEIELDF